VVHLVDPVARLVEQAREASRRQPETPLAGCAVGDARDLDFGDAFADAILLFGPLYHLVERADRLDALREALRVLVPGGTLFAVGISRFASTIDGLARSFLDDPAFAKIVDRDLLDGRHDNPSGNPDYFTEAYFHHPQELLREAEAAGFHATELLGIDGLGWAIRDLGTRWRDSANRESILALLRRLEAEPALVGASPHLMCVACKPRR
jgi:SAM-dependent methyltransferase